MEAVVEAQLEAGRGIVGDRYYFAKGTFSGELEGRPDAEVTLIEAEKIDEFNRSTGLALEYGALRRNIVTADVDLNTLVGASFHVGEVALEGIRLCEPCAHIAKLAAREVLPKMVHRAGLRARIVSGGRVRPADPVSVSVATPHER